MQGGEGFGPPRPPPPLSDMQIRKLSNPSLTAADRLMFLRAHARVLAAAEMARLLDTNEVTYQHHENGTRGVSRRAAARYAAYFGVSPELLLFGHAPVLVRRALVLGAIGRDGAIADRMSLSISLPESLPAPTHVSEPLAAYVVIEDLYPAYRRGDVVLFDPADQISVMDAHGRECVVELEDGSRVLRVVHATGIGLCSLVSYAHGQKPLAGVRPRGIWRVRYVEKEGVDLPLPEILTEQ